ncbi:hypothetical protein IX51_05410 [uncultured archaeon]|nr:hypothetical protein IX51_05410 [uncultured archaeon]
MINPEEIKSHFPIFNREIKGNRLVYLDSAATTQKPVEVVDAIVDYYYNSNSNVHRGIYTISEEATELYDASRENVSHFIGSKDSRQIVFVRNATEALNFLSYTLGRSLTEGDEILLSVMEHHSNIVPWQFLKEKGVRLKFVDIGSDGNLDLEDLKSKISKRTKIVSLTHVSNLLGTINPVKEIGRIAHENGSVFIVDGAQSVPHMPVDVEDIGCDFMAFSGHKMLGPSGIGVLYGKFDLLDSLHPFMGGGEMIREVSLEESTWNDTPLKFEAGTPNIEGAIGLSAAVDFLRGLGMENVRRHEMELVSYVLQKEIESGIKDLVSYGPREVQERGGVYSFNIGEIHPLDLNRKLSVESVETSAVHPHDVAADLDSYGLSIRSGHHCAMPLNNKLGIVASSRASFYIYNSREDVNALFDALKKVQKAFVR